MTYRAPLKDMLFTMQELAHIGAIAELPGFNEAGIDTAQAVLEECAKLNEDVIAPLNHEGDRSPSTWRDGAVTMSPGFKDAFEQFGAGGWQGLQHPVEQEFRHDEQRDPLDAGRRADDARQHQVHDVLRHVVLAVGDEDLGAEAVSYTHLTLPTNSRV